jgi:hypothetical protein
MDDYVRMALSHCRNLKQNETTKQRCFRKADSFQQEKLEELLSKLTVTAGEETGSTEDLESAAPEAGPAPSSLQLVEANPCKPKTVSDCAGDLDPAEVFRRVLGSAAEGSEEAEASSPVPPKKKLKQVPSSPDVFLPGLLRGSTLTDEEAKLLKDCKDYTPDTAVKKGKGKGKGRGKGKGKGKLASFTCEKKVLKKPAAKPGVEQAKKSQRWLPDSAVSQEVLLKRVACRAWHHAHDGAITRGLSKEQALKLGREASQAARAKFREEKACQKEKEDDEQQVEDAEEGH